MDLHVRAVSGIRKKSDAVCIFLAYFCAVLRFLDPLKPPLFLFKDLSNVKLFLHLGFNVLSA